MPRVWFNKFFKPYHHFWSEYRDRLASQDPKWAEIEARRHRDGRPGIIFLSSEHNLGWEEYSYQQNLEEKLLPHTWMHKVHWWLDKNAPDRLYRQAVNFWKRGKKGWAPPDTWSLDVYIAGVLGDTLEYLANADHGYPTGYKDLSEDEAYAAWGDDLRAAATTFKEYNTYKFEEDIDTNKLQEALKFVSENFESLWD